MGIGFVGFGEAVEEAGLGVGAEPVELDVLRAKLVDGRVGVVELRSEVVAFTKQEV